MESLTEMNAYLVIFSDDGRTGAANQSYLGKLKVVIRVLHRVEDSAQGHKKAGEGNCHLLL